MPCILVSPQFQHVTQLCVKTDKLYLDLLNTHEFGKTTSFPSRFRRVPPPPAIMQQQSKPARGLLYDATTQTRVLAELNRLIADRRHR